jgi:hypothetical protein
MFRRQADMPFLFNDDESLLQAIDWQTYMDAESGKYQLKNGHPINNSGFKCNDVKFGQAIRPVSATAGYWYSGLTTTTNYQLGGSPLTFPLAGCRPTRHHAWLTYSNASTAAVTRYINRFSDGEVWFSSTSDARTGTKISHARTSMNYPRDVRVVFVRICGAGGGGQNPRGLSEGGSGGGGGGGALLFLHLIAGNPVTVTLGAGGTINTNNSYKTAGGAGGNSSISYAVNGLSCLMTLGGGKGGTTTAGVGGTIGSSGMGTGTTPETALARSLLTISGAAGGLPAAVGGDISFTWPNIAPENPAAAAAGYGGTGGASGAGGGGGASIFGAGGNGTATNGSGATAQNGGGGGGAYKGVLNAGRGGGGCIYIYY